MNKTDGKRTFEEFVILNKLKLYSILNNCNLIPNYRYLRKKYNQLPAKLASNATSTCNVLLAAVRVCLEKKVLVAVFRSH